MTHILDGKKLSVTIQEQLRERIETYETKPTLVIIQIGNVPESAIYIKYKTLFARSIGAEVILKKYSSETNEQEIIKDIQTYNIDKSVHGILLQLPIPKHTNKDTLIDSILPSKDVDGLTAANIKALYTNTTGIIPATTKGILTLLNHHNISVQGKKVVIVGRSNLVGKPTALAFVNQDATVTLCHSQTKNLEAETKQADILVVAVGIPNFITEKHVRAGQVIIDVGINALDADRTLSGDVDFKNVQHIAEVITPVPGGVGPMTVASLFQNLLQQFIHHNSSTHRNV